MIHFSCDVCGRPLGRDERRHEVRIEIRVGCSPDELAGAELDFLDDDELDAPDPGLLDEDYFRVFRFDLCDRCHAGYVRDPLSGARRLRLRQYEN